jgi:hypothetical protein
MPVAWAEEMKMAKRSGKLPPEVPRPTAVQAEPHRLDPRKARENAVVTVTLSTGAFVTAKRIDMTDMLLEGLLPMPILSAAQKLITMKTESFEARMEAMKEIGQSDVRETLRKHAALACIDPIVCHPDDGNPDHMPADLINVMDLMLIWKATAVVPMIDPAAAARFREHPRPIPDPGPSTGEDVQPAAEPVVSEGRPLAEFGHY